MSEECLICKAPLEYLTEEEMMECEICHITYKEKKQDKVHKRALCMR